MEPLASLRPRLPWQPAAAEWLASRDLAHLHLDKRLGKCTLGIEWALRHAPAPSVLFEGLVVSPSSALADWSSELETDGQWYKMLLGKREQREMEMARGLAELSPNSVRFFLTNPQGLFLPEGRKVKCNKCDGTGGKMERTCGRCGGAGKIKAEEAEPTTIATYSWDFVIWDEGTVALCNLGTQTNEIAMAYLARAKYKLVMSGEPCPEGPHQIFEQMRFTHGHFMGHHKFWNWREENFKQLGHEWFPKPGRMAAIRDAMRAKSYTITRKEAGVEGVRTRETFSVELPPSLRKAYDTCEEYMEVPYGDFSEKELPVKETKYAVVSSNWLAQIAGGYPKEFPELWSKHKIDAVIELVKGRFRGESVVVTWRFNLEVKHCHEALLKAGVRSRLIWGSVDVLRRKEIQAEFNSGKVRVLVMQVKCAMHGINLGDRCDTMIRGSLPDRWEEISQPMDRIFNPNKKNVLSYVDIVARDTVDEDRIGAMGDKQINSRFFMRKPVVFTQQFLQNFKHRKEAKYGKEAA